MVSIFDKLKEQYPDIIIQDDAMDSGNVWYDLMLGITHVTVEHRPSQGYGLYHTTDGGTFGDGPDEVVQEEQLIPRLIELFKPKDTYERII